jgi:hypothetical protein
MIDLGRVAPLAEKLERVMDIAAERASEWIIHYVRSS